MIVCQLCKKEVKDLRSLSIHLTMTHVKRKDIPSTEYYFKEYMNGRANHCLVCGKNTHFISIQLGYKKTCSKSHSDLVNTHRHIKCSLCGCKLNNYDTLMRHLIQYHHSDPEKYFLEYMGKSQKCLTCGTVCKFHSLKNGYHKHCFKHLLQDKLMCQICYTPFQTTQSFQHHISKHVTSGDINNLESYYTKYIGVKKSCLYCNGPVNFISLKSGYVDFCSYRCVALGRFKERRETVRKKYRVDNVFQSETIKTKSKKTIYRKYQVENVSQSDEIKELKKTINQDKYDCDYFFQSKEAQTSLKESYIRSLGYDNPAKCPNVKKLVKFNKNTTMRGRKWPSIILEAEMRDCKLLFSKKDYMDANNRTFELQCNICNKKFMSYDVDVNLHIACPDCSIKYKSLMEEKFYNWLKSVYEGKIIKSDYKTIKPQELDFHIVDKKVAVELNGVYWHSDKYVSDVYHIKKTKSCTDRDIELIHIFEDDFINKFEIVKSIIKSKLNIYDEVVNGKSCVIKFVDNQNARDFLTMNHIDGFSIKNDASYGLYHQEKLVSIISINENDDVITILRYCDKTNLDVIDSFSIFLNFIIELKKGIVKKINLNINGLYNSKFKKTKPFQYGFTYGGMSTPDYTYFYQGSRRSKHLFSKKHLYELYHKKNIKIDTTLTERELAKAIGLLRIYDCGHHKFTLTL